jgi:8-oxo-dGTP pyrophosphatase MutT (NUDIX family)
METKTDASYGVIPLYKSDGEWQVLLIHQISYRGNNDIFWTFPKGHAEAGESQLTAARRELAEETGITKITVDEQKTFETSYTFVHAGVQINKRVIFWVGYCENEETHISMPHEIKALKWCTFDEATTLLARQNYKDVLAAVKEVLS